MGGEMGVVFEDHHHTCARALVLREHRVLYKTSCKSCFFSVFSCCDAWFGFAAIFEDSVASCGVLPWLALRATCPGNTMGKLVARCRLRCSFFHFVRRSHGILF